MQKVSIVFTGGGTAGHVTPNLAIIPLIREKLKNIDISYPKIEEQKKIAAFFEKLDNLITLHQRKCEELKNIKKYMLQNMFVQ